MADFSADVRKGVTEAKFNESQSGLIFMEHFLVSVLVGVICHMHFHKWGWWAFGGAYIGGFILLMIPFFANLFSLACSIGWGYLGYLIGMAFKSFPAAIVLAFLFFLVSFGMHLAGLQWMQDMGPESKCSQSASTSTDEIPLQGRIDAPSDDAILGELLVMQAKMGGCTVHGSPEYIETCIRLANQYGIKIMNPELQERLRRT